MVGGSCLGGSGIGQAAGLVVVGLERVKKTGNRFAHALAIPRGAFIWFLIVAMKSVGLKGLLAKDCEGAIVGIVSVMQKHANGPSQCRDFRLQIDNSVGGFLVHGVAIRAKLRPGQPPLLHGH